MIVRKLLASDASVETTWKLTMGTTMFGVTTPCITAVKERLMNEGYETLVFHATGLGSKAMEELVRAGFWLHTGTLDMVNFGAKDTIPSTFQDRKIYVHNQQGAVQRVHILDGTLGGALCLELFTSDGVGTMVTSDVYEGTLMARVDDIPGIKQVIQPLEESGALSRRSNKEDLTDDLFGNDQIVSTLVEMGFLAEEASLAIDRYATLLETQQLKLRNLYVTCAKRITTMFYPRHLLIELSFDLEAYTLEIFL